LSLLLFGALAALTPRVSAQGGVPLWTNRYNGPGIGGDYCRAAVVDGDGNVFVTGGSSGSSSTDYLTIKYSSAGVPLWTNRFNGPGNSSDYAYAAAVDVSGNVFVTGSSYVSGSANNYATIAYSSTGVPLWTNYYNGPGNNYDIPYRVVVDGGGNVFVTGYSVGSGSSEDYATIAYSSAGAPLWTNRYNGSGNGNDEARDLVVDGSGNVVVTGGSESDYVTIKYSSAGVPMWTNRYSGPGNGDDFAFAVATDDSGNLFVTGQSVGSGSFYDYATIAYSGAGVPLWTNRYNGTGNGDDCANAIAVDGSGNVFVAGQSSDGSFFDYATVAYSGAGVPLWTNRYNGPGNDDDIARAVAVDGAGNVFVTGYSYATNGVADYATIGYASTGVPLWTNRYDGPP
ncbi:MAG: SBBP repeat-containing protein, partial [Verrucomicrobiota bacterium]